MADINLKLVEQTMQSDFRASGQGLSRFTDALQTAINMAIGRINRQSKFATPTTTAIPKITSINGTMGLDDEYFDVFIDLVGFIMQGLGQRPAKGKAEKYKIDDATMNDRVDDIRQDLLNIAIAADTNDETSFIGLGALG